MKQNTEWTLVGPMGPDISEELKQYPTLAVDGGASFISGADLWVGDSDSAVLPVDARALYKHPPEKSASDFGLALGLIAQTARKLHLWGFLGGRKDHELFNFGEIHQFLLQHPQSDAYFYNENGEIAFHFFNRDEVSFHHVGLFSLGTLQEATVTLTGDCQYHIPSPYTLAPLSSFGLSNLASGKVTVTATGPVFIYFPEGIE